MAGAGVHCGAAPCLCAGPGTSPGTPSLRANGEMLQQHLGTLQKSHRLQTQQLLLRFPKYLICTLYLLLFFLMKKDFRSSAVDLELFK